MMNGKIRVHGYRRLTRQTHDHVQDSQEFYSIHHLFPCDNFRVKRQPTDAFTQSQPMHLGENHAAVIDSLMVYLCGYLNQIGIMRKYYGSKLTCMLQLSFVAYANFSLVIDGKGLDSAPAQSLRDADIHVLIRVDF
jgi:hypothetical protein